MTAVPVAADGSGRYAIRVGVATLTIRCMSPEPSVVSSCFHCSDPGAMPGQMLTTFFVTAGFVTCSGLLLLLFSCALAEAKREAASKQSAIDDFEWFLSTGPNRSAETSSPLFPRVRFCMRSPSLVVSLVSTLGANDQRQVA
jgi:hypothetical protein